MKNQDFFFFFFFLTQRGNNSSRAFLLESPLLFDFSGEKMVLTFIHVFALIHIPQLSSHPSVPPPPPPSIISSTTKADDGGLQLVKCFTNGRLGW